MHLSDYAARAEPTVRQSARTTVQARVRALRASPHRPLVLALVAAAAGAAAFADVTEDWVTHDPLAGWDVSFAHWLTEHRSNTGLEAFNLVTYLGGLGCLAAAIVAAIALLRARRALDATLVAVVFVGAEALNRVLKVAFHRPRPELGLVQLDTYSYPSGHAMSAAAVYATIAYLLWQTTTSWRARAAITLAAAAIIALVSFSRLYLGVHYLSDVLGGITAGATWAALSIALLILCRQARGEIRA